MEFKFHFEKYRGQFSALVLNHMKSQLPTDEWTLLRGLCTGLSMVNEPVRLDATQEEVLADSLCETVLDPSDILTGRYKDLAVQIGEIEEVPVFYVQGEGYYFWGRDGLCLDVMLTWPAYPPNWFEQSPSTR